MTTYYDEIEIEDFAWDPTNNVFHYPCPCGDRFEISKSQLRDGEEIATCPSCSLIVRVIYDYLEWEDYTTTDSSSSAGDLVSDPATTPAASPIPDTAKDPNEQAKPEVKEDQPQTS